MIPLILHRIWFGSFLPESYQASLLQIMVHNPSYTMMLWTDFATTASDEKKQFEDFCQANNISLRNIRAHPSLINFNLIQQELIAALDDPLNKRIHYVRASDLARISILFQEGGIYTDTDTTSLNTLPGLDAPLGLLVKPNFLNELMAKQSSNNTPEYDQIFYDFLAAEPNNPILQFASEISALDYQTYADSQHRGWESSRNKKIHLLTTIRLTGSSLRWAVNYKIAHGEISAEDRAQLFFDESEYLESLYEKSWLQEHTDDSEETATIWQQAELFREEIDAKREQIFSCYLPEVIKDKNFYYELPKADKTFISSDFHGSFFRDNVDAPFLSPEEIVKAMASRRQDQAPIFKPPELKLPPIVFNFPPIKLNFKGSALPCELLRTFIKNHSGFFDLFTNSGNINKDVQTILISIQDKLIIEISTLIDQLLPIAQRALSKQALELNKIIEKLKVYSETLNETVSSAQEVNDLALDVNP